MKNNIKDNKLFTLLLTLLKNQKYLKEELIKWYTNLYPNDKFTVSKDILETSTLFYEDSVLSPNINLTNRTKDIFASFSMICDKLQFKHPELIYMLYAKTKQGNS